MKINRLLVASVVFVSTSSTFSQHAGHQAGITGDPVASEIKVSPYAGEQARDIKSLSANEVINLSNGAGMAYAKAAELNGYPGPMHVLELAAPLKLSPAQRSASEQLLQQHKSKARELGVQLISAERTLDAAFVSKQVDAQRINDLTQHIGALRATLRAEHLQTHLTQTSLLNPQQIASYQTLRGYDKPGGANHSHQY